MRIEIVIETKTDVERRAINIPNNDPTLGEIIDGINRELAHMSIQNNRVGWSGRAIEVRTHEND